MNAVWIVAVFFACAFGTIAGGIILATCLLGRIPRFSEPTAPAADRQEQGVNAREDDEEAAERAKPEDDDDDTDSPQPWRKL